jgi:hypothetical protein
MAHNDNFDHLARLAVVPAVWGAGAFTGGTINTLGYDRARFIFSFGTGCTGSKCFAAVNSATGSSGPYAAISGAVLTGINSASTGAAAADVSIGNVAVIDLPVPLGRPYLKVTGGLTGIGGATPEWRLSATVDLYKGSRTNPPSTRVEHAVVDL